MGEAYNPLSHIFATLCLGSIYVIIISVPWLVAGFHNTVETLSFGDISGPGKC